MRQRLLPTGVLGGGALVLLVATFVSNGGNLAFNVVMSRLLGPDRYGALGSIVGFLTVFTVLTQAAQLAVAQAVAGRLRAESPLSLRRPVVATSIAGIASLLLVAAFSPLLEGFLHLASPGLVLVLGLVLCPAVAATLPVGVLLGRQRYAIVGISLASAALLRLGTGVLLVKVGLGTGGALAGSAIGQLVAFGVVLWPLRHELGAAGLADKLTTRLSSAVLSVVALSGLSAFTAVDSILARHFLSPSSAGHYVAAATAARIALFAPGAVALVVFPRFVALAPGTRAERRLLAEALIVTTMLSVGAAAVLIGLPHLAVSVLFGSSYGPAAAILKILASAGAFLGVISLLVYYHQARSSTVAACSWLGVAVASLIITISAHGSGTDIAWAMVATTASVLAVALVTALWRPAPRFDTSLLESMVGPGPRLDGDASLDVTMVVPYYNPGPRFASSVGELASALSEAQVTFEVIAVSDGSRDGSEFELERMVGDPPWLRRVNLGTNQGKGHALRVGLSVGSGRYLGFIDADGDIPALQVKQLIETVRTYQPDVILGSKRHPLSEIHYPPVRRLYSWGYQQFVRLFFSLDVRDTQTGLKLVRRDVLAAVLPRMLEKRFAFDLELLVVARRLGYRGLFEAPVQIRERFSSTIRLKSVWPMLIDTLAVFYRLRVLRYYDDQPSQSGDSKIDVRAVHQEIEVTA